MCAGAIYWSQIGRVVYALSEIDLYDIIGASPDHLLLPCREVFAHSKRHILPNAVGPITVESTLEFGYAIIEESGLSFLGFGIQPPTPSWGNLLSNAQEHFTKYPWLAVFPGLMIFFSIISINYIGDGLRDAFDSHKALKKNWRGLDFPPRKIWRFCAETEILRPH